MEALFKKYFWVVKVIGLAAATGLAASAVITQMGTSIALDTSASVDGDGEDAEGEEDEDDEDGGVFGKAKARNMGRSSTFGGSSVVTEKRKTAEEINARNIFCPTCVPVDAPPPTSVSLDGAVSGIRPGEVKSSLPLRLMATMEAEEPEYSLATVYDADAAVTGLYGVEDEIRPGVAVIGIDSGMLHIRNSAQLEYIVMGEAEQPRPSSPAKDDKKKKKRRKKPNPRAIDGAEDSINCPNDNLCIVERQFVEKLMGNPALLAKQARIVPSQKNGETQGFKFYGIRRGSLPRLLGLKNGDMLTEVNGQELNSMDQAMSLVMKLRRASNVSVSLVRKGQTIKKEIQIQ